MKKCIFLGCFLLFCLLCGFGSGLTVNRNESQLILASDLIVYGKIAEVSSSWNAQKTHIETTGLVMVHETLKGNEYSAGSSGNTLSLYVLGGTVGNESEWVEDMPVLIKDTTAIFFLKKGDDGRYSVLRISSIINQSSERPKASISENDIAEFRERIAAVLQNTTSPTTSPVTTMPTTQKAGLISAPGIAATALGVSILYQKRRKYF